MKLKTQHIPPESVEALIALPETLNTMEDKIFERVILYLRDIFEEESDVFGFGGTTDERISEFTIQRIAKFLRASGEPL